MFPQEEVQIDPPFLEALMGVRSECKKGKSVLLCVGAQLYPSEPLQISKSLTCKIACGQVLNVFTSVAAASAPGVSIVYGYGTWLCWYRTHRRYVYCMGTVPGYAGTIYR